MTTIKNIGNIIKKGVGIVKPILAAENSAQAVSDFKFTIPDDYQHDTQIDTFAEETRKLGNNCFNDNLTSKNFAKVTNKLEPGKTYRVRIFLILWKKRVTGEDCLTFLKSKSAIFVGGQGITVLQANQPDQFPVDRWTFSFDEKDALWEDADGSHRVPCTYRHSDGDWEFGLVPLRFFKGTRLGYGRCLLCVTEI